MKNSTKKTKDFKFKKFRISGGLSGMPVSTDGVLLGAWTHSASDASILDIGTGTGLLALMCAQRFSQSMITAVEIEPDACNAAQINFQNSLWKKRLNLIHTDVLEWDYTGRFDTIICNPPYFNSGEKSQLSGRATARHTEKLQHSELLRKCKTLLNSGGKASFILPLTEGTSFIESAKEIGFSLTRRCEVSPTETKPVSRLLFELSVHDGDTEMTTDEETLLIHENGRYSDAFTSLTKEFYLKM